MKGDMKQVVILGASFLVGIVAFLLAHLYLKGEVNKLDRLRQEIQAGEEKVKVLVASRTLAAGTLISINDIAQKTVSRSGLSSEPVTPEDFDRIDGRKVVSTIDKEGPILWAFIDSPYKPGVGLGRTVTKRLRAISISVGGASSVSGLVAPNDRIDVLGTFALPSSTVAGESEVVTMTILQNVTVLATGTQLANAGIGDLGRTRTRQQGYSMVTLEVSPQEAELLVFAEYMKGRLTLSLRNPEDMDYLKTGELQRVDFMHLQQKIPEYNDLRQKTIIGRQR